MSAATTTRIWRVVRWPLAAFGLLALMWAAGTFEDLGVRLLPSEPRAAVLSALERTRSVRLVAFRLSRAEMHANNSPESLARVPVVAERTLEDPEDLARLRAVFAPRWEPDPLGRAGMRAGCYLPHHAVELRDASGTALQTVFICFQCGIVEVRGAGDSNAATWLRGLKAEFKRAGLPLEGERLREPADGVSLTQALERTPLAVASASALTLYFGQSPSLNLIPLGDSDTLRPTDDSPHHTR